MPSPIRYVQGNTAPDLRLALKDQDSGNPIDVSAATVRLYLRKVGAAAVATITATKPGGGTDGVVLFAFPGGTFADAGMYEAEVEVTYASGKVETVFDKYLYETRESIA